MLDWEGTKRGVGNGRTRGFFISVLGLGQQWEQLVFLQGAVLSAVQEWEARNARMLREQEARELREQEQEQLLTYTREDAYNAVHAPVHTAPKPLPCAHSARCTQPPPIHTAQLRGLKEPLW